MMRAPPLLLLVGLALACDPGPETADNLDPSCAPLYEPTFDNVFDNTLLGTCGQAGTFCHATEGAKGQLVLDDREGAYAALVQSTPPRVVPGDPSTSVVMVRLETGDSGAMPPGQPLSIAERCAVQQWIALGAKR